MSTEAVNVAIGSAVSLTNVSAPAPAPAPSPSPSPSSVAATPTDQVTISAAGSRAAQFFQEAKTSFSSQTDSTELDASDLRQLQQEVSSGHYPPQALTEGLLSLLGSGLISAAENNSF